MEIPNLDQLNGLSGILGLVNGLLLWPIVRSLKDMAAKSDKRHAATEHRVRLLEAKVLRPRKAPRKTSRKARTK